MGINTWKMEKKMKREKKGSPMSGLLAKFVSGSKPLARIQPCSLAAREAGKWV